MQTLSVPPTAADRVRGRLDAPLVIVKYGDYACPYTRRAHAVLLRLLAEREGAACLVFRHFPLRHLHPEAQQLSELMQAIREPDSFWTAHERLMGKRRLSVELADQELQGLGLSLDELRGRSAEAALAVQADVDRGLKDGVHSTPSFFFNGAPHDGPSDPETLRECAARAAPRLG